MPTLSCSPNPAPPSTLVAVAGAGFANAKTRLLLDGVGATTNIFRPRKDGTFNVGITVSSTAKTQILVAQQQSGTTWSEKARTSIVVQAVVVPPPVVTPPPTSGPLNDPQPDVSGTPPPPAFVAGTMSIQQAIDAAPSGSILNLAVTRTVDLGTGYIGITKPLTIVFGVPGGAQLTITKPDPASGTAIAILSDDVKLYRPRMRGIGMAVGATPSQTPGREGGSIAFGGSWKGGVKRCEIVNADISDCLIDGIFMSGTLASPAEHLKVSACLITRTGRNGVTGGGGEDWVNPPGSGDWQLARSHIHHTNLAGYDAGDSASCVKWLWLYSALVEDNEFDHTNAARGFWTDTMVTHLTFRRNRVHDTMSGVFIESSHYVEAYDNVIYNNSRNVGWGWGGGITLATSDHCDIHHNTIYQNGSGVTVISQFRNQPNAIDTMVPTYGGTVEISVHDNTIIAPDVYGTAWVQDWAGILFAPTSNNHGANNKYWYPSGTGLYAWNGDIVGLSAYNATPGEEGGTLMTTAQKDAALVAAGLL